MVASAEKQEILSILLVKTMSAVQQHQFGPEWLTEIIKRMMVEDNLINLLSPQEKILVLQQKQECGIQGVMDSSYR